MSTSAILIAFRLESFNCRTTVNVFIHIKYVKNGDHLGIVQNNERTRKNITANINMDSSWKYMWSTADPKRYNFIIYKVKGVLWTNIFLAFLKTQILVKSIFFRKNFSSIQLLLSSKLRLFAKQYNVLVDCFLKFLLTFEWINIIWLLTFEWNYIVRLLPERPFFLSIQCSFFLSMLN